MAVSRVAVNRVAVNRVEAVKAADRKPVVARVNREARVVREASKVAKAKKVVSKATDKHQSIREVSLRRLTSPFTKRHSKVSSIQRDSYGKE